MKRTLVVIAILVGLAFSLGELVSCPFYIVENVVMAGEGVGARQARIGGREVGEVVIHRRVVLRIRTSAGGMDPFGRAVVVAHRLADYLKEGYPPDAIFPDAHKGSIVVTWQGKLVVTVDTAHAGLNNTNEHALAKVWANNIRQALGSSGVPPEHVLEDSSDAVVTAFCVASWYGERFHGRSTANGETFDRFGFTAAHRYLPFGTKVQVTNLHNGKSVMVTINDRGPYVAGRAIDLSSGAATAIGLKEQGIGNVKLEVMGPGRVL